MLCAVGAVGRGLEAQSSRMFSGDLSALGWLEQGSGGGVGGMMLGSWVGASPILGGLGCPGSAERGLHAAGACGLQSERGNGEEAM